MKTRKNEIKRLLSAFAAKSDSEFVTSDLMLLAEMAIKEAKFKLHAKAVLDGLAAMRPAERDAALQALVDSHYAAFKKAAAIVTAETVKSK